MPRADAIHLGLMLSALALAYVLPFELLLIAYAVLGPAHYLTEISWLHDRQYFLSARPIALLLAAAAVVAVIVPDAWTSGLFIWIGFAAAAIGIGGISWTQRAVLLAILAAITVAMGTGREFVAVAAVLLPTLIHVCVFTLVFMTLGAWRSGSRSQAALVLIYLAAIALILVLPPGPMPRSLSMARLGSQYFYDYALGFTVLLALSLIHVVLEFPLNTVSIRQLAGIAVQGFSRQARTATLAK